jgi:DNA-binding NtrC family response regulator
VGDEPKTIPTVVQPPPKSASPSFRFVLRITEGIDAGAVFVMDATRPSRALVGQSPVCDLRLRDPAVSRRHAALEVTSQGLRVRDLGSTNGTWVDRVKVLEADLRGEETIRLGSTAIHVDAESAEIRLPDASSFGRVLGASPAMRRLYPLCERLAGSQVPVIVEGETGTGKEALVEALHEFGPRASGPFVIFDCTAVPNSLVESELFGHERGAFTGALSMRKGVFEQAHGGTLLIDEIGDLDLGLQPKLLRALERFEIRRVGGDRWLSVDVRVIAATRRDLDREVQEGRFRDDLFHRLAVARLELPPLREREGDIELLATRFWQELGGDPRALPESALARWRADAWPGNVRELRNAVARQLALGDLPERAAAIARALAPTAPDDDPIERLLAMGLSFTESRDRLMEEFEERYVTRLLAAHRGNVTAAAAASGISRRYFQRIRIRSRGA